VRPDDLDDLDPVEPDAVLLGRVRARSASLRRRRRAQRVGSVVVAVGVLALAGGIALTVGSTTHSDVSGAPSSTTSPSTTIERQHSPTGISTRLVLPSTTLVAGSAMSASVAVDNNTGHALPASSSCGTPFEVALGNAAIKPNVGFNACLQQLTIPVGTSSYPVTVRASYPGCGPAGSGQPVCLPTGAPSLPLGSYEATVFESLGNRVVPIPPPIAVTVIAPGDKSVEGLKAAALAWSNAFLTGSAADIFAMEGSECTPTTSTTLSGSTISAYLAGERATMAQHFGMPLNTITAHGVSVRNFTGTTGEALVQYDLPEAKTGNDNWVTYGVENGEWKVTDCHAPIGGSSSSASSAAPPP
jgi:hypothetical protein